MKYAVLVVLLCFLASVFTQAPTNTTAPSNVAANPTFAAQVAQRAPPPPPGAPPPAPPPVGSTFNNLPVITDDSPASRANLTQNQLAVFFVNGVAKYLQNIPQPPPGEVQVFAGEPGAKAPQNSDCFNGQVENTNGATEVCDYKKDSCCDVSTKCSAFLPVGSACRFKPDGSNATLDILLTATNILCFADTCKQDSTNGGTICARNLLPAGEFKRLPRNCAPKAGKRLSKACRQNPNALQTKPTFVGATPCYEMAISGTSRLAKRDGQRRKFKKSGKGGRNSKLNHKSQNTKSISCNGKGVCPCSALGCSQTPVL